MQNQSKHLFDGTCRERGACSEFAPKPAAPRTLPCGCCSVGCSHERCAVEHKRHRCASCSRPFVTEHRTLERAADMPDVCTDCREVSA